MKSFNCLADQELREGIKEYSEWPTIPQVYVKGEFVGGCDIILSSEFKSRTQSFRTTFQLTCPMVLLCQCISRVSSRSF
jgi:monothiol glutaredoxin